MKRKSWIILFGILVLGCIEEVSIQTEVQSTVPVENILVVEATLTDEMKTQHVLLSRGSSFLSDDTANFERNATVLVVDDRGRNYEFIEGEPGSYLSVKPFAAVQGIGYQLRITTSDGRMYESKEQKITGVSVIDNVYAERIISDNQIDGMAIYVDSSNPNGDLNDYRYTYEETYKIIAPNWSFLELEILTEGDPSINELPDVFIADRKQEEQVCFNTEQSTEIVLSEGAVLSGNRKTRNLVRFLNSEDAVISHRYSILVKQLLQTQEAAKFYRTLLQFSQNESLFTEVQPGLIEGNVKPVGRIDEVVFGFFSVASVVEKRLFFNYEDFFPDEPLPPYFNGLNCDRYIAPILGNPERDGPIPPFVNCGTPLIDQIKQESVEYFATNSNPPGECQGPYLVTFRACGDCTALGSNVVPEFWIE